MRLTTPVLLLLALGCAGDDDKDGDDTTAIVDATPTADTDTDTDADTDTDTDADTDTDTGPSPVDDDNDGAPADLDCDDNDPERYPGHAEVCGDGVDQDCTGLDAGCDDTTWVATAPVESWRIRQFSWSSLTDGPDGLRIVTGDRDLVFWHPSSSGMVRGEALNGEFVHATGGLDMDADGRGEVLYLTYLYGGGLQLSSVEGANMQYSALETVDPVHGMGMFPHIGSPGTSDGLADALVGMDEERRVALVRGRAKLGNQSLRTWTPAYTWGPLDAGRPGSDFAVADLDDDGTVEVVVADPGDFYGGEPASVFVLPPLVESAGAVPAVDVQLGHVEGDNGWMLPPQWGPSLLTEDLDGDGVVDLGVGLPAEDGLAGAFAWFLGGSAVGGERTLDDAQIVLRGPTEGLGIAAQWLGDVDGDGVGEYAVSELGDPWQGEPGRGRIYIVSADLAEGEWDIRDVAQRILAPPSGHWGLFFAHPVGDVTSDGRIDVAVSSSNQGAVLQGNLYLITGGW